MKIAVLTPLAPVRTGIASYCAMLLPALGTRCGVTAVVDQDDWEALPGCDVISIREYRERRAEFDAVLYQLGNNPYHEFVLRESLEFPGIAVLHDAVLHHLIVEMTLARGDAESYVEELRRNHGEAGAAWARGRAAGYHAEIGNFLFPASIELANRSRAVIVHNEWAARRLRDDGVRTPIDVVPHPMRFDESGDAPSRDSTRASLGFDARDVVVGMFGFVTSAKRPEVVFEAFAIALQRQPRLKLLVVGEPAPNLDVDAMADELGIGRERITKTGYVTDVEFARHLEAADRIVNLRYPSAGETSGALIQILATGKPVAVSEYAQFAEYPPDLVTRIPFGESEVAELARFMTEDDPPGRVRARTDWVRANADLGRSVVLYLKAIERAVGGERVSAASVAPPATIPIFPSLEVERITCRAAGAMARIVIDVRNRGRNPLEACTFGRPEYRMIVHAIDGGTLLADRWLALPGDLGPGQVASVGFSFRPPGDSFVVEILHGVEGLPVWNTAPFAREEITVDRG